MLWSGFILLFLAFPSCTTNPVTSEGVEDDSVELVADMQLAPNDVVGTWQGFIPCAGCTASGLTYDLVLLEDYTFEESIVDETGMEAPVARTGTWSLSGGIVELDGEEGERTRLSLSTAGELRMLDMAGKPINDELRAQYSLKRNTSFEEDTAFWEDRRKVGVDFVATGHEPGWLLEIDKEKGIFFKTRPLESVVLDAPMPAPTTEGNKTIYLATAADGEEIRVELMQQACADAMSGKERPYTVLVMAEGKVYSGCGMFLGEKQ